MKIRYVLLVAIAPWLLAGCDAPQPPNKRDEARQPAAAADTIPTADSAPAADSAEKAAVDAPPAGGAPADVEGPSQETWDVFYMQGAKVGYVHTVRRSIRENGRDLLDTDSLTQFEVARAGQVLETRLRVSSVDTPAGHLVRFRSEAQLGPAPLVVRGQVDGDWLDIEQQQGDKAIKLRLPWPQGTLGFFGTERSLELEPLKPGETRKLRILVPIFNQVADDELVAHDYEETPLLHGTKKLLRIHSTQKIDGNRIESVLWTDAAGRTLKTRIGRDDQEQEMYRCTKADALAPAGHAKIDLIQTTLVRTKKPVPRGTLAKAQRATYLIRLKDDDPAKVFAGGAAQLVEPLDEHTARVTVWPAGPKRLPPRKDLAPEPAPGDEYLVGNGMLQTDDPAIAKLAAQATDGAPHSAERALALERLVYRAIKKKNFSQAFASATEVARSREGDCTEHAVLTAALARATGIPSRVALGLVYLDELGGFAFHMWTEVYIDGHWLPLDATRGQGGSSAAHLKLADSSLKDGATYNVFLRIVPILGQLEIDVQEIN